jgi:HSP20 family protein
MINELSILDDIFNSAYAAFPELSCPSYSPDVDVLETKNMYTISMNLPGLTEKDVDISLKDGILTISSAKTEETKNEKSEENAENDEDKAVYLIRERHTMEFARSFKLPRDTDHASINASFKNGVLEVNIPRKEAEQPKRIAITAA